MNHRTVLRRAFAFAVMLLLSATAQAQLFRAYLAVAGNDANPCTVPAPCRLLPAALAAVADGGRAQARCRGWHRCRSVRDRTGTTGHAPWPT